MSNITLVGIHSVEPDTDGALLVTFITKYIGNYPLRLSAALVEDLRKSLPPSADDVRPAAAPGPPPEPETANDAQDAHTSQDNVASPAGQIKVRVPGDWIVTADAQRNVVVVVFDPKTEVPSGFALSPETAVNMSDALQKSAAMVSTGAENSLIK